MARNQVFRPIGTQHDRRLTWIGEKIVWPHRTFERTAMRIACLGGGPAGLYFAISMKLRAPSHEIDLYERNRADDTFGWGVVFSDQTVENLMANDPVSGAAIASEFAHWDDIEVHIHGETI